MDDYGSVRLDSRGARDRITDAGIKISSRFDLYDALETKEIGDFFNYSYFSKG